MAARAVRAGARRRLGERQRALLRGAAARHALGVARHDGPAPGAHGRLEAVQVLEERAHGGHSPLPQILEAPTSIDTEQHKTIKLFRLF